MIELYKQNLHKMTTPQEKAQCLSWFIETKSDVQTQRNYIITYGRDPPSRPSIRLWHKKFIETGTVFDTRKSGRPRTSEENIERVRQAFQRFPMKSIRTAARQLELPRSTVHKVIHKKLRLYANKMQMLQALQPNDMPRQKEFAVNMLQRISEDEAFRKRVCFSDEAIFHVLGKLNKYNVRIWGSKNPHASRELQRDSPKVNIWCGIMCLLATNGAHIEVY